MANVVELFLEQTRLRPRAVALVDRRRRADRLTTFAELEEQSARIATLLADRGIRAGSPVLLFHPPSAELYAVIIALFRLGAVAMVVDMSAGHATLADACRALPPAAVFTSGRIRMLAMLSAPLRHIPLVITSGRVALGAARLGNARGLARRGGVETVDANAPALITFTSGSTGAAKGAVRSHGVLRAQHEALGGVAARGGEVDLVSLPIVVLTNLGNGATSVIPDGGVRRPGAIAPGPVLDQVTRGGVQRITVSPVLAERLVDAASARGAGTRSRLHGVRIVTGGGPVFPDFIARAGDETGADVIAVYGSTEAEPIAHVSRAEIGVHEVEQMRAGAGLIAGRPVPETRVRIIPSEYDGKSRAAALGSSSTLPSGTRGEIIVSGGHVVPGYLHGLGDAETKIHLDGTVWHRTGDAGYLDDTGRLWLLGRTSAAISDSRGELHPFAVECAARLILPRRRTALVSYRDERMLLVAGSLPPADREALGEGLRWARLDRIIDDVAIPLDKRHNSKVDYRALGTLVPRLARQGS